MTIHSGADAPIVSNDANETPKRGRIDLTQFEGIGNENHMLLIEKTPTDGFHWSVGFENDVEASMSVSSKFGKEIQEEADRFYHAINKLPDILAELKRMYAREDMLLDALRIIRDDLDEAISEGYIVIQATNGNDVTKIRNFANDASQ